MSEYFSGSTFPPFFGTKREVRNSKFRPAAEWAHYLADLDIDRVLSA